MSDRSEETKRRGGEQTKLAKVATEIGEQIQTLLNSRGLTLIPQAQHNRFGSAIQSRLVRIGDDGMEDPPEEEGKAVFAEIEKLLTKGQKRTPGYTALVNPILETTVGEAKGRWEIRLVPKSQDAAGAQISSRSATEELHCLIKHLLHAEEHAHETAANALRAGNRGLYELATGWFGSILSARDQVFAVTEGRDPAAVKRPCRCGEKDQ